jgi:hypothetical protein
LATGRCTEAVGVDGRQGNSRIFDIVGTYPIKPEARS